jgi:hypothetical protein
MFSVGFPTQNQIRIRDESNATEVTFAAQRMQYETPVPKGESWLQRLPLSRAASITRIVAPDNFNLGGFSHIHQGLLSMMSLEMLNSQP